MNILSYARLTFVYNYNLLHAMQESKHDRETFATTFKQRKFNNKHRIRNKSLPVAENVRYMFDPPVNINTYIARTWFRTGYYYDRFVVQLPICIINGTVRSYVYNPLPSVTLSSTYSPNENPKASNHESLGIVDANDVINFEPKPYVITETLKKRPASPMKQQGIAGCPVLSGLFASPTEGEVDTCKNDMLKENDNTIEEIDNKNKEVTNTLTVSNTSNKNIFYKIKIRRKTPKSDQQKEHPTYGRYDLVAQAIKNVIPQPSYKPEMTIGPNMIRFAWHCCAHYDKASGTGGSSGGTMRFAQEFNDLGNTGLNTSKSYLDQVQQQFPWISFADLYTYAGCIAIEHIGGPKIEWKPGRSDCPDANKVPPMGRLPLATEDANHIREVFYNRLGFNAQETVALIGGGHGIGGCHSRYSGFNGIWTRAPFSWDNDFFKVLLEENWSLGIVPETGIEQYYNDDRSLMMLNTDIELLKDPEFRRWVEIFAADDSFFNEQFALAFAKLLELGVIRDDDGIQRVKV